MILKWESKYDKVCVRPRYGIRDESNSLPGPSLESHRGFILRKAFVQNVKPKGAKLDRSEVDLSSL